MVISLGLRKYVLFVDTGLQYSLLRGIMQTKGVNRYMYLYAHYLGKPKMILCCANYYGVKVNSYGRCLFDNDFVVWVTKQTNNVFGILIYQSHFLSHTHYFSILHLTAS